MASLDTAVSTPRRPSPAVSDALATVNTYITAFGDRYPDDTTVDHRYLLRPARGEFAEGANYGWTTSFLPGMFWLAFELTGDSKYRQAGERHIASFARRVEDDVDLDTHDLGFLYSLSCVAPWSLFHQPVAERAAVAAADHLMHRFLEPAGIIQAWGDLTDPRQRGRGIIDSLMNMPLLYWAASVTGQPRYAVAAYRHTIQLRDHILRPDGTTFHTFYWDPVTGEPLRGSTEQGHADDSCWARGQAWGIYGFSLGFRHTADPSLLRAARRCADHFIELLPADHVAYWDLVFGEDSGEPRDSSAAAIAVCGLQEMAGHLPGGEGNTYREAADAILDALSRDYVPGPQKGADTLLLHSVYDLPRGVGVDEGCLWGDYFYLEALTRREIPTWKPYWGAGSDPMMIRTDRVTSCGGARCAW